MYALNEPIEGWRLETGWLAGWFTLLAVLLQPDPLLPPHSALLP